MRTADASPAEWSSDLMYGMYQSSSERSAEFHNMPCSIGHPLKIHAVKARLSDQVVVIMNSLRDVLRYEHSKTRGGWCRTD
jgi:hypothetical protein